MAEKQEFLIEQDKENITERVAGRDHLTPDGKVHDRQIPPRGSYLTDLQRVGENGRAIRDALMRPGERLPHGIAARENSQQRPPTLVDVVLKEQVEPQHPKTFLDRVIDQQRMKRARATEQEQTQQQEQDDDELGHSL